MIHKEHRLVLSLTAKIVAPQAKKLFVCLCGIAVPLSNRLLIAEQDHVFHIVIASAIWDLKKEKPAKSQDTSTKGKDKKDGYRTRFPAVTTMVKGELSGENYTKQETIASRSMLFLSEKDYDIPPHRHVRNTNLLRFI